MQSRFQTMSDSIVQKNILFSLTFCAYIPPVLFYLIPHCVLLESFVLDNVALDEMGERINELEQSINELRGEMGQDGSPSPSPALKTKEEPNATNESE
ncbi:unnamed protein product [Cuscuta campestris]|uniref:Uncharacterized protein n=1 Tax=Cuscuta campestris TaxID=132261 RepID=A0A484NL27_9ASTE|nr:unnamed protein product [Cuscuta campestris]